MLRPVIDMLLPLSPKRNEHSISLRPCNAVYCTLHASVSAASPLMRIVRILNAPLVMQAPYLDGKTQCICQVTVPSRSKALSTASVKSKYRHSINRGPWTLINLCHQHFHSKVHLDLESNIISYGWRLILDFTPVAHLWPVDMLRGDVVAGRVY